MTLPRIGIGVTTAALVALASGGTGLLVAHGTRQLATVPGEIAPPVVPPTAPAQPVVVDRAPGSFLLSTTPERHPAGTARPFVLAAAPPTLQPEPVPAGPVPATTTTTAGPPVTQPPAAPQPTPSAAPPDAPASTTFRPAVVHLGGGRRMPSESLTAHGHGRAWSGSRTAAPAHGKGQAHGKGHAKGDSTGHGTPVSKGHSKAHGKGHADPLGEPQVQHGRG